MGTKGFITLATGKEEYYQLAFYLLQTYRFFTKKNLPFAIICDRKNQYTKAFDKEILIENATNSYLDKLRLAEYLPYDENLFIDSDCLAYGDLSYLFDYFKEADDVSCFGRVLDLDDVTGWFEYDHLEETLQKHIDYVVGLHGGIYYMRNTDLTKRVYKQAIEFVPDYEKFKFKGNFETPGDEPLIALSMALHQCHPIPFRQDAICCYWEYEGQIELDITHAKAYIKPLDSNTRLIHWGTRFTKKLEYKKQVRLFQTMSGMKKGNRLIIDKGYDGLIFFGRMQRLIERGRNKMIRIVTKR